MKIKESLKSLSQETKKLLNSGETGIVDYKRDLNGLKSDDLVAFANSQTGGTILVGVDEITEQNTQKGKIVGCDTSDKSRLVIMSKALACIPPISLEINIENTNSTSIFRIKVPSGIQKPYCTSGGTYKVRKDGRNAVLTPTDLLDIYLAQESKKFNEKFTASTKHLLDNIKEVSSTIDFMESTISSKVESISSSLGWTEMEASDTNSYIQTLISEQRESSKRINALIKFHNIVDPLRIDYMNKVAENLIEQYEKDEKIFQGARNGKISFTDDSKWNLTEEEIKLIIKQSADYLWDKRNPKKSDKVEKAKE